MNKGVYSMSLTRETIERLSVLVSHITTQKYQLSSHPVTTTLDVYFKTSLLFLSSSALTLTIPRNIAQLTQ